MVSHHRDWIKSPRGLKKKPGKKHKKKSSSSKQERKFSKDKYGLDKDDADDGVAWDA